MTRKPVIIVLIAIVSILLIGVFGYMFFIHTTEVEVEEIDLYYYLPMHKGINIGNALDAPKGEQWDVTMNNSYFTEIKNLGFDTVRLPVRFSDYTLDDEFDTLDPEFMLQIDDHINYALAEGLVIILDLHHFNEIMDKPYSNENKLYNIWRQLATRYKDYPKELVFEVLNEPFDNLQPEILNVIYSNLVNIIRETNLTRKIILGPYFYNNISYLDSLELPTDRNVMLTFHYYEPNEVTFQGNIYHPGFEHLENITWTASEEEMKYLQDKFQTVANYAKKYDVDVFLGEFGVTQEAPEETRLAWINAVVEEANKHGFSYCYWEYISGFGLYDMETKFINNALVDILVQN